MNANYDKLNKICEHLFRKVLPPKDNKKIIYMKNKTLIIIVVLLSQAFSSCDKWLDVQPATDIDLTDQISTADGFHETLNGVYINMTNENLYGHHLMYGAVEQVAQNINNTWNWTFPDFAFDDPNTKNQIAAIWKGLYNAIVNDNIILDNIDENANLFVDTDYKMIKAEALAIRAFLHFDALRLFGDAYQDAGENPQIPYVSTFERVRYPHLTADQVYEHILTDLDKAEVLLQETDPILGHNYDGKFFDPNNRRYRMNYYAVLALKARVYITMGDKANALIYAQKVINEFDWKWVNISNLVNVNQGEKDVLFINEVVAALNVTQLGNLYNTWFGIQDNQYHAGNGTTNYAAYAFEVLIPPPSWWMDADPGPGINDWRYLYLFSENGNGDLTVSTKYDQPISSGVLQYKTVPLIRITEMMLIAAEALLETDKPQALAYLDRIRTKREVIIEDLSGATEGEIMNVIVKEFRKETYLEGQLMYLYKRLGYTQIPAMNSNNFVETTPESFIFPLPDNELEFGNIPN